MMQISRILKLKLHLRPSILSILMLFKAFFPLSQSSREIEEARQQLAKQMIN